MNENVKPAGRLLKFLQFPVIRIALGFLFVILITALVQIGIGSLFVQESRFGDWVAALTTIATIFAVYFGFVRLIERRHVTELSLSYALGELAGGILLGTLLFSSTIAILWAFGFYQVSRLNEWRVVSEWLLIGMISGVFEEILVRGILFRITEEYLGTWISLGISALVFGALHLANPNATLWAGLAIAIEAGILLAGAYVHTRRLWVPIGIHFAWNFVQGGIFGVAVSGIESRGLLDATLNGPLLLSGGEFGAEASIFAVLVCLSAGCYYVWKSYNQGKFIKPFWNRS
jgi:uncharacterized protein